MFEPDHAADALARFDALTAAPAPHRVAPRATKRGDRERCPSRGGASRARPRRVRGATRRRLRGHRSPDRRVDDTTARPMLATIRCCSGRADPSHRHEPLATLGDSLALCRVSALGAADRAGATLDVGARTSTDHDRCSRSSARTARACEIFAADQLGDAVVRLYERYAELLPAGPERERAATIARSLAAMIAPLDPERSLRCRARSRVRRTGRPGSRLSAGPSARACCGASRILRSRRRRRPIATDDVTRAAPDACSSHWTTSGPTAQAAARASTQISSSGLRRRRTADARRVLRARPRRRGARALRRADRRAPRPAARRVRPTPRPRTRRVEAAVAARDVDALPTLFADEYEVDRPPDRRHVRPRRECCDVSHPARARES